jgi:hypothetical protein
MPQHRTRMTAERAEKLYFIEITDGASSVSLRQRPPSESGASGDSAMMWARRSCPLIDNGHYRRCRTSGCKGADGGERRRRTWSADSEATDHRGELCARHIRCGGGRRYGLNSNMLFTGEGENGRRSMTSARQ